jgi:hypothetical protein
MNLLLSEYNLNAWPLKTAGCTHKPNNILMFPLNFHSSLSVVGLTNHKLKIKPSCLKLRIPKCSRENNKQINKIYLFIKFPVYTRRKNKCIVNCWNLLCWNYLGDCQVDQGKIMKQITEIRFVWMMLHTRAFRLPPRRSLELHSSGLLRSEYL